MALAHCGDKAWVYRLPELLESHPEDKAYCSRFNGGIAYLKDPAWVPVFVRLLQVKNPDTRKAAIRALRFSPSAKGASSLAAALDEPDLRVRYDAIMGLAAALPRRTPSWAWAYDLFLEDPETLTKKWKEFWQEEKAKCPTVEEVLKEFESERAKVLAERVEP